MNLYVDLDTLNLIEGPGFRNPVSNLRFKRGDAATLNVVFLTGGATPTCLGDPNNLNLTFGMKASGDYGGTYLASSTDWTKGATSDESPQYSCSPNLNTVALNAALNFGSSPESASIQAMGEITWNIGGGTPTSTRTFMITVDNDVNQGGEGTPQGAPSPDAWLASRGWTQQLVTKLNAGLTRADILNLFQPSSLSVAQWATGAKMVSMSASAPSLTVKTSTGYAKFLRWDGTWGSVTGTGVAGNSITPNTGSAIASPFNARVPKFVAVFPCNSGGTITGSLTSLTVNSLALTYLDVSGLTGLTALSCYVNSLTELDVSTCTSLQTLDCHNNNLCYLNVAGLTSLTWLNCSFSNLKVVPLSGNAGLTYLDASWIGLTDQSQLSLSQAPLIATLNIGHNAFTYNARINRLSPIQEHAMITRAVKNGVSVERIAAALDMDVREIKSRMNMLRGIHAEAVDLLKDKQLSPAVFRILKRVTAVRQIEIAELMVGANNYTKGYAEGLFMVTTKDQLVDPQKPKAKSISPEDLAKMEAEMEVLERDFKSIEESYAENMLNFTVIRGYLKRLLENSKVVRYISTKHPDLCPEFERMAAADSI